MSRCVETELQKEKKTIEKMTKEQERDLYLGKNPPESNQGHHYDDSPGGAAGRDF